MSKTTICNISNTILNSGIAAFDTYYDMTKGECWPYYTPEYWYTVAIAKALSVSGKHEVLLENSLAEVRKYANRGKRGSASKEYRTGGRADIVLWKKNFKPVAIVEVKKGWSWKQSFETDLNRIAASLSETGKASKNGGTVKNGFFVVITGTQGKDAEDVVVKLNRRYEYFLNKVTEHLLNKGSESFLCTGDIKFSRYFENNLYDEDDVQKSQVAVFAFKISIR